MQNKMDPFNMLDPEVLGRLSRLASKLLEEYETVDEGVELGLLLDVVGKMQEELQRDLPDPVCPVCRTRIYRASYQGYYDSFDHWECKCGDGAIPVEHTAKGAYAR